VQLCLFEQGASQPETRRIPLPGRTGDTWHGHLPGGRPGLVYGFRVDGPYDPAGGHRFNPHKLLLDPCARAVTGDLRYAPAVFGYSDLDGAVPSVADSAGFVPKAVVADAAFDWGTDRGPRTPWERTVLYECHVKGLTRQNRDVEPALRGTYLGLASDAVIEHFKCLGVTAVELLPVSFAVDEVLLAQHGLVNYWGYNPIALFAPTPRYACAPGAAAVPEFKTMVKRLHAAGLEVILDMVFNHTAESDQTGPTLCFRGLDNASYYHLRPDDPSRYVNYSGCGNALNVAEPAVLCMVLDCLRYWVEEMHVDGFRLDLAVAVTRGKDGRPFGGPLLQAVRDDPVLASVKLIAEPWDAAPDGYSLGRFPLGWAEWNDRYRGSLRRMWLGRGGSVGELATRLAGSSDLFQPSGRGPLASVNYVTSHDGFTLADAVSYNAKRNHENREENRDGANDEISFNHGCEGPTHDAAVLARRTQARRNLVLFIALSLGVPMISGGDELGRTQGGNNNAYCQDGPMSWLDWNLDETGEEFLDFFRRAFALRRECSLLQRDAYFTGRPAAGLESKDVTWLRPDGGEMTLADWENASQRSLGMWLREDVERRSTRPSSAETRTEARPGLDRKVADHPRTTERQTEKDGGISTLLALFNLDERPVIYRIPKLLEAQRWRRRLNSARPAERPSMVTSEHTVVEANSIQVMTSP